MERKKTILIVISKDVIRRNILDTKFWPKVLEPNSNNTFVLVVQNEKVGWYRENYGAPNVVIRGFEHRPKPIMWKVAIFGVRTALASNSAKRYRMQAYTLGKVSWISTFIKTVIWSTIARIKWYKRFVRQLVIWFVKSPQIQKIYDEEKPDLAFIPSLIDNDFDVPFGVEAKRRQIRVIGMVRSWDNMSSHSLLGVVPDRMIHQNRWIKELATGKFQEIREEKHGPMDVIGLPHYDFYKDVTQSIISREEFFAHKGLDVSKKTIFLAGSQLYRSGYILPVVLDNLIKEEKINGPIQVLFRPHPRPVFPMEAYKLEDTEHIVLDKGTQAEVRFSDRDAFINAFVHSDVAIGISSTIAIDASVFRTPVIDINFDDPDKEMKYWLSVNRLYDTEDHYERVVEIGGTTVVNSPNELAESINKYVENPALDEGGRNEILKEFVEPFDGNAGERLANILTEEIKNLQ